MNAWTRVKVIGRGVAVIGVLFLCFQLVEELRGAFILWPVFVWVPLFVVGALCWLIGAFMLGYTDRGPK
jgi:hypothetical protein